MRRWRGPPAGPEQCVLWGTFSTETRSHRKFPVTGSFVRTVLLADSLTEAERKMPSSERRASTYLNEQFFLLSVDGRDGYPAV